MGLTANKLSLYNSVCNCFCDVVSSTNKYEKNEMDIF